MKQRETNQQLPVVLRKMPEASVTIQIGLELSCEQHLLFGNLLEDCHALFTSDAFIVALDHWCSDQKSSFASDG